MYVYLNRFAVFLKLAQHSKSTILQNENSIIQRRVYNPLNKNKKCTVMTITTIIIRKLLNNFKMILQSYLNMVYVI